MERNLEEMKGLLEQEQSINEMNESIKKLQEEITDLKYEQNMMRLGNRLRELKQEEIDQKNEELERLMQLRDETQKEVKEGTERIKTEMKEPVQKELDSYQRRAEIEKQRPQIELYTQGITNLEAEVTRLEAEIQEISEEVKNGDVSRMERMNAAAALIRSDKARIADMKSKVEPFNNLKVLEDNIEEYSDLERTLANIDQNFNLEEVIAEIEKQSQPEQTQPTSEPVPPENSGTLTPEELEALNEVMGLGEEPDSNSEPEEMKGKDDYDWGDLTDAQIDDLWAEGITPDSQEYRMAYGNFVEVPSYKPVVHDIIPESEPTPPPQDEPFKSWEEELFEAYLSQEEFDNMGLQDKESAIYYKAFEKSTSMRYENLGLELSEEERKAEYQKFIEEMEKETKTFNQKLRDYIKKAKNRLRQLENGVDDSEIQSIKDEIEDAKGVIKHNDEDLKLNKLAIEKDILFDGEAYMDLIYGEEMDLESETTPPPQDEPFKSWTEELLKEYFSKEEIAILEDKDNTLMEKVFAKSNLIRFVDEGFVLSEEERKAEYQKYIEEREKETKIFNKNLKKYIAKNKLRISEIQGDKELDADQIASIQLEIGKAESAIIWSDNVLKGIKLAIEKDVLFDGLDDNDLYNAGVKGEIDLESVTEPEPEPLSPEEKNQKLSDLQRRFQAMGMKNLRELYNDLPEEIAGKIKNGITTLSEEEIVAVSSKVEEMEEKAKRGPTPPTEVESPEEENKTHENRLAKMLGTFGSWITSMGKANRDKVAKSEQEEANLPTPAKEKNIFKRMGKAIGKKVSQWREKDVAEELNETNREGEEVDPTQKIIEEIQEETGKDINKIINEQQNESENEKQEELVGYDTRDQGFIKKWMDGTLRKAVRVELADGTRVWLSPDGQKDSQSEKNPFEKATKKENKNRNKEKKSTHKGTVGEGDIPPIPDMEEEPKSWDVPDEVKRATEEVGKSAGEKEVEVEKVEGDAVITPDGEEIDLR